MVLSTETIPSDPGALGYHIAFRLALKGARVYITARNQEKAQNGVSQMEKDAGDQNIDVIPLVIELSSFESTRDAAQNILKNEQRLDILTHNAAIWVLSHASVGLTVDCFTDVLVDLAQGL